MWANSFREILPHWELADSFTAIEAAALIAGVEPTSLDESLEWFRDKQSGLTVSDGIQEFTASLGVLLGAIRSGKLKADSGTGHLKEISVDRDNLVDWMLSRGRRFRPAFFFPDEHDSGKSASGADRQRLRQLEAENARLVEQVADLKTQLSDSNEEAKYIQRRFVEMADQRDELQRQLQQATAAPQRAPQETGPAPQQATAAPQDDDEKPLHQKRETTYLNTIGALVELIQSPRPGRDSPTAVIRELVDNYGDRPGIGERTLEKIFPIARERLKSY